MENASHPTILKYQLRIWRYLITIQQQWINGISSLNGKSFDCLR